MDGQCQAVERQGKAVKGQGSLTALSEVSIHPGPLQPGLYSASSTCPEPDGSACCYLNGYGSSVTTRPKDFCPPEPGGSACCYWNGNGSSATTRDVMAHRILLSR